MSNLIDADGRLTMAPPPPTPEEIRAKESVLQLYRHNLLANLQGICRLEGELGIDHSKEPLSVRLKKELSFELNESVEETLRAVAKVLSTIEWAGSEHHYICPICQRDRQHGHAQECDLTRVVQVLKKEE